MPIALKREPPYAVSRVVVGWIDGRIDSLLNTVMGRTLASAPVPNLHIMSPSDVSNLDIQAL